MPNIDSSVLTSSTLPSFIPSGTYGSKHRPADKDQGFKPSFWFNRLWTPEMTEIVVRQTNLYQAQVYETLPIGTEPRPWHNVNREKLEQYFAFDKYTVLP